MKIKDDKEMLNAFVAIIGYLYEKEQETELTTVIHVDDILDMRFEYTMHLEAWKKHNPGRD